MSGFKYVNEKSDIKLLGHLTFDNADKVLTQFPCLPNSLSFDASGLEIVDSAGLSVLLHWARAATEAGHSFVLKKPRQALRLMIDIAGLGDMLTADV